MKAMLLHGFFNSMPPKYASNAKYRTPFLTLNNALILLL